MTHELRLSGYNAAGAPLAALLAASPEEVAIQSDLDGDGDTDDANERVTYRYDATRQAVMRATGAAPPQPMLDRVPAGLFAFRYYDAHGAELSGVLDDAARALVRRIDIQFTVEYPSPDPALPAPLRLTQATRVKLRNPPS
jgi:hypothetical protein